MLNFGEFQAPKVEQIFIFDISEELNLQFCVQSCEPKI